MIWAAMLSAGVGPLCFLKSTVNAAIYQEILEHLMLPSADKLYGDADFIFQQDLAPAHTAKGTKSWFNDHVLDWPGKLTWPEPHREYMGYCQEDDERHQTQQCRWPKGHYQSNRGFHYTGAVPQADCLHATTHQLQMERRERWSQSSGWGLLRSHDLQGPVEGIWPGHRGYTPTLLREVPWDF